MSKPNPTGWDRKTYVEASTSSKWRSRDPWARNEAWRYTGPFSRWNRFRGAFPGLGIATVAFAGYCVYEAVVLKGDDHGHGGGHEEAGEGH